MISFWGRGGGGGGIFFFWRWYLFFIETEMFRARVIIRDFLDRNNVKLVP